MDSLTTTTADTLKSFLKNEKGNNFCVPWVHAQRGIEALSAAGFTFCRVTANARAFVFDVANITFRDADGTSRLDEALECVYGDVTREQLHGSYCITDVSLFPLVLPETVDVFIHDTNEPFLDPKQKKLDDVAVTEYKRILTFLARISGYAVHFHAEGGGMKQPWPDQPKVLHIATNGCPPGQAGLRYAVSAYGLTFNEKGIEVLAYGPTPGRGIILKDEAGESTIQLLGNTWYLLFPSISHYNTRTSSAIFARAIGEAWTASQAEKATPQPVTEDVFVTTFTTWVDAMPKIFEDGLRRTNERIEQLQKDLANAYRDKTEQTMYIALTRSSAFLRKAKKRAKKDWASLTDSQYVQGAVMESDGVNLRTQPILIPHDGHVYNLGSFVVRFSSRGQVSVWNEAPTHYLGIPHPHIDITGHPCFGNAGTAIAQATGEIRFADAARYVLRWLAEGYTPALADKKIEQWPRVGETTEEYHKRLNVLDPTSPSRPLSATEKAAWEAMLQKAGPLGDVLREAVDGAPELLSEGEVASLTDIANTAMDKSKEQTNASTP